MKLFTLLVCIWIASLVGCGWHSKRPSVTALPASPQNLCEPPGIPFYLPKPLLVVSKNFHHIEEPTVGLTDSAPIPNSFDAQETYADVKMDAQFMRQTYSGEGSTPPTKDPDDPTKPASTATSSSPTLHSAGAPLSPGAANIPSDGLAPHTFFTYEIVFVPDLTQKYVLQVEGGAGEMRAAMNLVNGWQFTGLGPYYIKDSSTAQNIMARGIALNLGLGGAADVVNSIAKLQSAAPGERGITPEQAVELINELKKANTVETFDFSMEDGVIEAYAEIYVYEPYIEADGTMHWRQIVGELDEMTNLLRGHQFSRKYLGKVQRGSGINGDQEPGKDPEMPPSPQAKVLELLEAPQNSVNRGVGDSRGPPRDNLMDVELQSPGLANEMFERHFDSVPPTQQKHRLLDCFRPNSKVTNRSFEGEVSDLP